jgi:TPP-dependent pyruvate/acetoin dehydrogenase alpha subunit
MIYFKNLFLHPEDKLMPPDLLSLYAMMLHSRLFEEAVAQLWHAGLISGEMHLGTGEEAIAAGIVSQLQDGDALALDHRGTPPLLMRGVDPLLILRELLGRPDGLCAGQGGHMHLFSKQHLAASSGIVGASGPVGAGFALAAQYLHPGAVSVALFGDGAINQGMLMESMTLASAWKLPLIFVCKDDRWAITTESHLMTGGSLAERARGFGLPYLEVDGRDAREVWQTAKRALQNARSGGGPTCLHAHCVHLEAHFLGYQLLRTLRTPLKEIPKLSGPLMAALLRPGGGSLPQRLAGVKTVVDSLLSAIRDPRRKSENDPLVYTRLLLADDSARLVEIESQVTCQIDQILVEVLGEVSA